MRRFKAFFVTTLLVLGIVACGGGKIPPTRYYALELPAAPAPQSAGPAYSAAVLPFKAESFDNVFHIGGINFFSEKKKAIDEMIRVARPGSKIVIADESERVAQVVARVLRLSRANQGRKVDTSVPVHLVPESMEQIRVDGIWKRHGQYHGYCLEFRKPA